MYAATAYPRDMTRRSARLAAILIAGITVACVTVRSAPATRVSARGPRENPAPLLAFTERGPTSDSEIHVIRADGTGHRVLTDNRLNDLVSSWSPHGRWLGYRLMRRNGVRSYYAREVDGRGFVYVGGRDSGLGWSPDERRVLIGGERYQVVDLETGARTPVFPRGRGILEGAGWSPDASTIVFALTRYNDFWVPKVFAADADGTKVRRLARNGRAPAWSPDGRWIAFSRDVNDRRYVTVYVVRPDGTGLRRLSPVRVEQDWAWSPDGRWIAVQQWLRNGTPRLGVLNVERGGIRWLSEGTGYADWFRWTPDGMRILFLCGPPYRGHAASPAYGICVSNPAAGRARKITGGTSVGYGFQLSPDGRNALFTNDNGVYVFDIANRKLRQLTSSGSHLSWSPDGDWVAVQLRAGLHTMRVRDRRMKRITGNFDDSTSWQPRTS